MKARFKSSASFACALTVLALAIPAVCHAQYYMTANDVNGATTSFNGAGTWNNGLAPSAGNTYTTEGWLLRVPNVTGNYTFAGDSLTIGGPIASGATAFSTVTGNNDALIFKADGESATVNNLILDGGQVRDGDASGNNAYLYGNIYVTANGGAFMCQETNWIESAISGVGPIYIGDNGSGNSDRVIVFTSGLSTYSGDIIFNNTHSSAAYSRLTFAPGSIMNFTIGANGVNNQITGISGSGTSGTLTLNGNFAFDLSGADNTIGDSWDIVDPSVTTVYGSTFAVDGFTQNGSLWGDIANGVNYEYNTTDGILRILPVPSNILVINTADNGPGSLRAALASAVDGDTIDATRVTGTITLTTGELAVPNSVTLLGPGPGVLTVSGNNASPVFNITGTTVTISGLTIANGYSDVDGAGINAAGNAGSVLTVSGCVITNNTAANGGGIFNSSGVTMTISNCTIAGNSAAGGGNGGGICSSNATLMIVASTLSGNLAGFGGGIANNGSFGGHATLTINTSTLSTNSAFGGGGAILNYGSSGSATLTINASTLTGNSSSQNGGGIFTSGDGGTGTVQIADTILNAGASGANFYNYGATIISDGYNLSSDAAGGDATQNPGGFLNAAGDIRNTDPLLGPLQNNGGPTLTMLPLFGSPAIDAGDDSVTNFLATDQRGYPRLSGAHVDIGAVEAQWAPTNHPPLLENSAWTAAAGTRCFQFTFSSVTNADFTVLAATNLALPLPDWTLLAPAIQCSPGQYQFTDPGATNYAQRFYQVVSP